MSPDDAEIAFVAADAEEARYWTDAASVVTCAWPVSKLVSRAPPGEIVGTRKFVSDNLLEALRATASLSNTRPSDFSRRSKVRALERFAASSC